MQLYDNILAFRLLGYNNFIRMVNERFCNYFY